MYPPTLTCSPNCFRSSIWQLLKSFRIWVPLFYKVLSLPWSRSHESGRHKSSFFRRPVMIFWPASGQGKWRKPKIISKGHRRLSRWPAMELEDKTAFHCIIMLWVLVDRSHSNCMDHWKQGQQFRHVLAAKKALECCLTLRGWVCVWDYRFKGEKVCSWMVGAGTRSSPRKRLTKCVYLQGDRQYC